MICECGEQMRKYVVKKPDKAKGIVFICDYCKIQVKVIPKKYRRLLDEF